MKIKIDKINKKKKVEQMNEWGLPISKDKIIARRNRLIEYQKLG